MNGEHINRGPQPDTSPEVEFAHSVADKIQDYARRGQGVVLSPPEADYAHRLVSWHVAIINAFAKAAEAPEATEADALSNQYSVVSDILDNMRRHADNNWPIALSEEQVGRLGEHISLVGVIAGDLVDNHNGHLEAEEKRDVIGQ